MQAVEVTRATRLSQICAETLAFAVQLRRAAEPDPAALRQHQKQLFHDIEIAAQAAGKDQTAVQACLYALAAFLDEIVLTSNWSFRPTWAGQLLLVELFKDATGNQGFYTRLESLRGGDAVRKEALEVYGLCLGLGFRGRYSGMAGLEEIKALRGRIHQELADGDPSAKPLSLHWQPEEHVQQIVRRIPAWLVAAVCAGVLLVLVVILRLVLGGTEGGFLATTLKPS